MFLVGPFKCDIRKPKFHIPRNERISNSNTTTTTAANFVPATKHQSDSELWLYLYMRYTTLAAPTYPLCSAAASDVALALSAHKYLCVTMFDSVVCLCSDLTNNILFICVHGATMACTAISCLPSCLVAQDSGAPQKKPMYIVQFFLLFIRDFKCLECCSHHRQTAKKLSDVSI